MQQQNFTPLYPPLQVRAGVLVVDGFGIALRVLNHGKLRVEDGIGRQRRSLDARSRGLRPRTPGPDRPRRLRHPRGARMAASDRRRAGPDRPRWRGAGALRSFRLRRASDPPRAGARSHQRPGPGDRARTHRRQTRRPSPELRSASALNCAGSTSSEPRSVRPVQSRISA